MNYNNDLIQQIRKLPMELIEKIWLTTVQQLIKEAKQSREYKIIFDFLSESRKSIYLYQFIKIRVENYLLKQFKKYHLENECVTINDRRIICDGIYWKITYSYWDEIAQWTSFYVCITTQEIDQSQLKYDRNDQHIDEIQDVKAWLYNQKNPNSIYHMRSVIQAFNIVI